MMERIMDLRFRSHSARLLTAAVLLGLVAFVSMGCEKSTQDQLRTAKGAVLNERPDVAEENLEAVLAVEPDNFEARRLMGQVAMLRGNFASAEEQLAKLWKEGGFDDDNAELSSNQRSQKNVMAQVWTDLYLEWSASLDPQEEPDKFEEVVRKGLEYDERSNRLNSRLVDFHESQAKKLVEQGDKLEAADHYEEILDLRTLPARRDKAKERATNLRFEANKEKMLAHFNETAKPKLQSEDRYDEEEDTITFTIEQPISEVEKALAEQQGGRVRLNAKNKEHAGIIQTFAAKRQLGPAIQKLVVEATGIDADSDFSKLSTPEGLEIVDSEAGRRTFSLTASIPVDDLLKLGFEVKEETRRARQKDKEKQADEAGGDAADKADDGEAVKAEADPEE
jgi:hypothetical protein